MKRFRGLCSFCLHFFFASGRQPRPPQQAAFSRKEDVQRPSELPVVRSPSDSYAATHRTNTADTAARQSRPPVTISGDPAVSNVSLLASPASTHISQEMSAGRALSGPSALETPASRPPGTGLPTGPKADRSPAERQAPTGPRSHNPARNNVNQGLLSQLSPKLSNIPTGPASSRIVSSRQINDALSSSSTAPTGPRHPRGHPSVDNGWPTRAISSSASAAKNTLSTRPAERRAEDPPHTRSSDDPTLSISRRHSANLSRELREPSDVSSVSRRRAENGTREVQGREARGSERQDNSARTAVRDRGWPDRPAAEERIKPEPEAKVRIFPIIVVVAVAKIQALKLACVLA